VSLCVFRAPLHQAATAANAVVEHQISFAANYTFYNNLSTEHIFQVQNVAGDNGFAESFSNLYSPTAFGGRGDAPFSTNLIAAFAANREIYATLLTRGRC
jgi:hypothetical protein